jgi:hypothetical protein
LGGVGCPGRVCAWWNTKIKQASKAKAAKPIHEPCLLRPGKIIYRPVRTVSDELRRPIRRWFTHCPSAHRHFLTASATTPRRELELGGCLIHRRAAMPARAFFTRLLV